MKGYHIYFFFLKFVLVAEFLLLFVKRTFLTEGLFLAIDVLFKLSLGLFIPIYFFFNRLPGIDYEDRLIM